MRDYSYYQNMDSQPNVRCFALQQNRIKQLLMTNIFSVNNFLKQHFIFFHFQSLFYYFVLIFTAAQLCSFMLQGLFSTIKCCVVAYRYIFNYFKNKYASVSHISFIKIKHLSNANPAHIYFCILDSLILQ